MTTEAGGSVDTGNPDAGSAGAATGGQAQSAPWYGQADDVTTGYLQSKGWDKPDAGGKVVQSYRELEKLVGTIKGSPDRIIVAPKDWDNKEEVDAYYNKLGRPEAPEKYSVYGDNPIIKALAAKAFENGIPDKAFKATLETLDGTLTQMAEQQETEWMQGSEQELASWKREQGQAYDQKVQFGKMAAQAFPEIKENMAAIERAMGTSAFMNLMASLGEKIGEDTAVGLGGQSGFVNTPQMAKQQIGELQADTQFMQAYFNKENPGHEAAVAKMTRLFEQANPQG